MSPEVARDALLATHGGLSLELCAVLYHLSPMALYRLICTFGHHSLVTVLTRCGEHGDAGDHAASASSSTCISGYQRLNTAPNSPFRVFTRVWNGIVKLMKNRTFHRF